MKYSNSNNKTLLEAELEKILPNQKIDHYPISRFTKRPNLRRHRLQEFIRMSVRMRDIEDGMDLSDNNDLTTYQEQASFDEDDEIIYLETRYYDRPTNAFSVFIDLDGNVVTDLDPDF
jgi:hypothetical protein